MKNAPEDGPDISEAFPSGSVGSRPPVASMRAMDGPGPLPDHATWGYRHVSRIALRCQRAGIYSPCRSSHSHHSA